MKRANARNYGHEVKPDSLVKSCSLQMDVDRGYFLFFDLGAFSHGQTLFYCSFGND